MSGADCPSNRRRMYDSGRGSYIARTRCRVSLRLSTVVFVPEERPCVRNRSSRTRRSYVLLRPKRTFACTTACRLSNGSPGRETALIVAWAVVLEAELACMPRAQRRPSLPDVRAHLVEGELLAVDGRQYAPVAERVRLGLKGNEHDENQRPRQQQRTANARRTHPRLCASVSKAPYTVRQP